MKYEFHVGDYVETKTNYIGYITKIGECNNGCSLIYICYTDGKTYPIRLKDERIEQDFKRIGQYDFTKKDEGKIESLVKSWILEDANGKGEYYFDSREVIKKINELVDVVNELRDKND